VDSRSQQGALPALATPSLSEGYNTVLVATLAMARRYERERWFTSTEVVYGVTGTEVTRLPEYGVSP